MTPGFLDIRALTPELLPDFLSFFDAEAFADNPAWGFCYCQFSYVDHAVVQWKTRTPDENRKAACGAIGARTMTGYLAYRDGKPVGWCNAAPRTLMAAFDDEPVPDASVIGQITCFIVASSHRRSGVARALLSAACDGFRSQGFRTVVATALPRAETDAQNHYGPLSMFEAAGFVAHGPPDEDGYLEVRLDLVERESVFADGSPDPRTDA